MLDLYNKIKLEGGYLIYKTTDKFIGSNLNPFTNMPYDKSWIIYCLTEAKDYQVMSGSDNQSVYTLKVSKQYPQWQMSIFDFLQYQETYNKNIILSISNEDYNNAKKYYGNHTYDDHFLRDYEPRVLIHSTTNDYWQKIKKDGCLKSWNVLQKENLKWEKKPIGQLLGDPDDFSDFIMFSGGSISSELVVLSKQRGEISLEREMEYRTGARLYFDIKKMAEDGLLIRDGAHLKVRDQLPLNPYLIWVGEWETVGLDTPISTPKEFTELANLQFNKLFKMNIKTID